jgi:hypothetical protein
MGSVKLVQLASRSVEQLIMKSCRGAAGKLSERFNAIRRPLIENGWR